MKKKSTDRKTTVVPRVQIAENFARRSWLQASLAVILIYLPLILTVPFVVLGVVLVRLHLTWLGGMKILRYNDFVPDWVSHRYQHKNQIVYAPTSWYNLTHYRIFWIFNCKLYCPLSVALFRYAAYLVTVVENWWCPFGHSQKNEYSIGAIDKSYWHIMPENISQLHPDDRDNPIWNEKAAKK